MPCTLTTTASSRRLGLGSFCNSLSGEPCGTMWDPQRRPRRARPEQATPHPLSLPQGWPCSAVTVVTDKPRERERKKTHAESRVWGLESVVLGTASSSAPVSLTSAQPFFPTVSSPASKCARLGTISLLLLTRCVCFL